MKTEAFRRVFIVGCEGSGTTLLQAFLAAHPAVWTCPETQFFVGLFASRHLKRLGIARSEGGRRIEALLAYLGRPDLAAKLPRMRLLISPMAAAFVEILDTLALDAGRDVWVEKSPRHIDHIEAIQARLPDAAFIHVVRDGAEVVASLHDRARRFPEAPGFFGYRDVDRCVDRWLETAAATLRHSGKKNHATVHYERLVARPREALEGVCRFLGLRFEEAMLRDYRSAADRVILPREPWKEAVRGPLRATGREKFLALFDARERGRILDRLARAPGFG